MTTFDLAKVCRGDIQCICQLFLCQAVFPSKILDPKSKFFLIKIHIICYDFTFYSQEGNDGFGSDIGWTCPSGSQLTQEVWAWQGHTDKPALATLELHANSSQEDYWGAATFTWWYESDFVTPEEVYEGEWGLTANGEYSGVLMLDMTRTGGKRYTPGETERIIHDGFIVQVPMAFEDYTYLSVDKGQHGSYLPIQLEPDTVIYFYPW